MSRKFDRMPRVNQARLMRELDDAIDRQNAEPPSSESAPREIDPTVEQPQADAPQSSAPSAGDPDQEPVWITSMSFNQRTTIEMLVNGKTVTEAARLIGISRSSIHRWLANDPQFRAAYNQWHAETEEQNRSHLLMLTDKATAAVEKALEAGDARTAMQLLKGMGMLKPIPPGSTNPDDIRKQADLERRRKKRQLSNDTFMADLPL